MNRIRDPRALLWLLLAVLVAYELLYSSRWLTWHPPGPRPGSTASPARPAPLRQLLEQVRRVQPGARPRIWFAPYTTFPETGMVESLARSGVYDTLLAIPSSGIATNYGASKLTPADTLFSLASATGLAAELQLARRLGYGFYALDLGAVTDPDAGVRLCQRSRGCVLSGDGYALFPISASTPAWEQGLGALQRRIPLLPQKSAGVTWGPLVLPLLQWGAAELKASPDGGSWLVVQARLRTSAEIFRYSLEVYPRSVQPLLRLANDDVRLALAPDVISARFCLGPVAGPCRLLDLGPSQRRLAIGDSIPAGALSRLELVSLLRQPGGQGLFSLELRSPASVANSAQASTH